MCLLLLLRPELAAPGANHTNTIATYNDAWGSGCSSVGRAFIYNKEAPGLNPVVCKILFKTCFTVNCY